SQRRSPCGCGSDDISTLGNAPSSSVDPADCTGITSAAALSVGWAIPTRGSVPSAEHAMKRVTAVPRRARLEYELPIELMHTWALREGNRKKPIYELHKWWARRLGSTFRTLLVAATSSKTTTTPWEKAFLEAPDLSSLTVLDPF